MLTPLVLAATLLAPADSITLRILATTDFHGALETKVPSWSGGRRVGGIAVLKALSDSMASECGCPVLKLNAGDQMQGTLISNLVYGRSAIEGLNLLGLAAAAIGNHDFDWGVDTLKARMAEANYPWLAANIIDSLSGRRPDWVKPSVILSAGGLRVGVIGYLSERTKQMVMADNVAGLIFPRGRAALEDQLAEMRRARVDLTVLVAHEGGSCRDDRCAGELLDLARELDSTDVQAIVGGHSHTLINTVVNGIPILVPRADGTALGVMDLVQAGDGPRHWRTRVEDVFADRVTPDTQAAALVTRYRPEVDRLAHRVVVTLADELSTAGSEYPLGHLIADAQRAAAKADVALMNNGGIRRPLRPGPVTYGDLFELQPFGNAVVWAKVSGAELKTILEYTVSRGYPRYHLSGATVRYDPNAPIGQRVEEVRLGDGAPLSPGRTYRLALSDFLATGGDDLPIVPRLPVRRTGKVDLDVLIEYLRQLPQPIRTAAERRYLPVSR